MRLLTYDDRGEIRLTRDLPIDQTPDYAILSHTWGDDQDEITFQELENGPDKNKAGYRKLQLCGEQAKRDKLDHFWVDTCCINKAHGPELSENINLMFRYYQKSARCYVYLSDVKDRCSDQEFRDSRWFKRGWTLQELLAPRSVEFYSSTWEHLGSRVELEQRLQNITQIPIDALRGIDLSQFSRHERMRWVSGRQTRKEEDRAYCLLGIFGVSLLVNYGEGESEAFSRLEHQIKRKSRPTVQNIDDRIRDYYLSDSRLDIERLSGQRLPMDTCFINLAIIDRPRDINAGRNVDGRKTDTFSLATRLKVDTTQSETVTLEALFRPRKLAQGTNNRPKRVVIWGRAGMGKTTLCKKIVHEFLSDRLWNDLYDRIFWLPLRRLRLMRSEPKSVVDLILETCFHGVDDDLIPADVLQEMLQGYGEKCLFILDGLDEVSYIDYDSPMGANIYKLMKQKSVIITSRLHASSLLRRTQPDLEFETVGFFPEQVQEFLDKEAKQENIPAIQSFIRSRPIVESLVRIPIQLDAICYVWSQETFQYDEMTMTLLYQAIVLRLWQKDIVRLGKEFQQRHVTPQQIRSFGNVECFVGSENSCLEELAFTGLYHQLAEFNADIINAIAGGREPLLDSRLSELSFLRSADRPSNNQTHHFIHLTFQEFFAARFFVRCWSSGKEMVFPKIRVSSPYPSMTTERITPIIFIQREKYNARYNIFWRFVAGLIQVECGNEALDRFFDDIGAEPLDRIGLTHQILIAHCLHEISSDQGCFRARARKLECDFQEWTEFYLTLDFRIFRSGYQRLLQMAECPYLVFQNWLNGPDDTYRTRALQTLRWKSDASFDVLLTAAKIAEEAQKTGKKELFGAALSVIMVHSERLPEDVVSSLTTAQCMRLWSQIDLNDWSFQIVGQPLLRILAGHLQNQNFHVRLGAASLLSYQRHLPGFVIEPLFTLSISDQEHAVRFGASKALRIQTNLPVSVVEILTRLLQNPDFSLRFRAAEILSTRKSLPVATVEVLVKLLQDHETANQILAIKALRSQVSLPASAIESLIRLLHDQDADVRSQASWALANKASLPASAIESLIRLLHDQDADIRSQARWVLANQAGLSASTIESLTRLLHDQDADVRSQARWVLANQASLPASTIEILTRLLHDQDADVRFQASWTLVNQAGLPASTIESLTRLLYDQYTNIRYRASSALVNQASLPVYTIESLTRLLHDQDADVRFEAIKALVYQASLPAPTIEVLVTQFLEKSNDDIHLLWIRVALQKAPLLSKDYVQAIAQLLKDEGTAPGAAEVLQSQTEFYELFAALDVVSLTNLLRYWLESYFSHDRYSYVTVHKDCIIIEIDGKQWKAPLKSEKREGFEQRWLQAQKTLGVPLIHGDHKLTTRPAKRTRSPPDPEETRMTRSKTHHRKQNRATGIS